MLNGEERTDSADCEFLVLNRRDFMPIRQSYRPRTEGISYRASTERRISR